jgi:hypothetical protein
LADPNKVKVVVRLRPFIDREIQAGGKKLLLF